MSRELDTGDLVLWCNLPKDKYVLGMVLRARLARDKKDNTLYPVWDVEWSDTNEVCEYTGPTIKIMRERYEEYESSRKASSQT